MRTILVGSTRLDPVGIPTTCDIVITDGVISAVTPPGQAHRGGAEVIDVTGLLILPGLVDIQVHFREPGRPEAEDIASGTAAAIRGGITGVVMMANTTPPIDRVEIYQDVMSTARTAVIDVRAAATISQDRMGAKLVDMAALYQAGARTFTDDGNAVMDSAVMRGALEATTQLPGAVIAQHAEDEALVAHGALNEGPIASQLHVLGRPAEAEAIIVARDLYLASLTGGRYHVLHASTAETVRLVAAAKKQGVDVTCEATPQHLVLTQGDVPRLGANGKMNPPLRTAKDVTALRRGLAQGTVDAVATDHAPHPASEKARSLDQAPPGMLGCETMASVIWTYLVHPGVLTPAQAVVAMSTKPAAIGGFDGFGRISVGAPAHLCIFDPTEQWRVDANELASRSSNSPWEGEILTGRVVSTIFAGQAVMDRGVWAS